MLTQINKKDNRRLFVKPYTMNNMIIDDNFDGEEM